LLWPETIYFSVIGKPVRDNQPLISLSHASTRRRVNAGTNGPGQPSCATEHGGTGSDELRDLTHARAAMECPSPWSFGGVWMNKGLTFGLGLLLAASMAVAQDTNSAQASSTNSGSNSNQTTVQGCLRGSHDNWTLTDNNGQTWSLKGDDAKWTEHNGHTVSVTGTSNQSASMPQGTEANATETAGS